MQRTPLSPFGMAVSGLQIKDIPCASPQFTDLTRLVATSRVVVFRGQALDDADFVQFLNGFGDLTFTDGETPVLGAPDLNVVTNIGRTTPARSSFHTDTSYVAKPPAFSALRPVLLPSSGGDTLFTDQVRAAARLPEKARRFLMGRTVLHGAAGLDGQEQTTRQPLLRRHPVTDEVSLYLSTRKRCTELQGVDAPTSERIIAALYRHSTRASAQYRHEWKPGDVLMWDNRVSMHKADHDNLTQNRLLHRGMVSGEVPLFATHAAPHSGSAGAK